MLGTAEAIAGVLSATGTGTGINTSDIERPNATFTERRNELDMRIGKVLKYAKTRSVVSLDIYNALNSDAMIVQNQAYASYLRPVEILNARLFKVSWNFDF